MFYEAFMAVLGAGMGLFVLALIVYMALVLLPGYKGNKKGRGWS